MSCMTMLFSMFAICYYQVRHQAVIKWASQYGDLQIVTLIFLNHLYGLTLALPGPAAGVGGSLLVTVAYNPYARAWGK